MIEAAPPAVTAPPVTGEHVISTQALVKRFRDIDAVAGAVIFLALAFRRFQRMDIVE